MTLLADVDARVFCLVCDCSPRDGPELLASAVTSKNEMAMRAGERHPIYLTVMAFVTFLLLSSTQSQTGNNLKLANLRCKITAFSPIELRVPGASI